MPAQQSLFRIERFASEIPLPTIELRLPWPPSVNHYWVSLVAGKRVMVVIGKEGKQYREAVTAIVLSDRKAMRFTSRLSVEILAMMPDKRERDLDNLLKASLDAMAHAGVYESDSQIDRLVISRAGVEKPGWIDVRISEMVP